jgi:hypothetical protein
MQEQTARLSDQMATFFHRVVSRVIALLSLLLVELYEYFAE